MGPHAHAPRPAPRRRPFRPLRAGLLGLACLATGCATANSPTQATVPPAWRRTNAWGPRANAARAAGCLKPLFYTEEMAAWAAFARDHLHSGDLIFRYGLSYSLGGRLSSRFVARSSASRFSHLGIISCEGDTVYVYDSVPPPEGVRKIPFEFWMLDAAEGSLAVRRLLPPYRHCVPTALAYCEDAYLRQVPFDTSLNLDDARLYCSEMLEKAFRCAGLSPSEPVPLRCLPHYLRFSPLRPLAALLVGYDVNEPIFAIGSCCFGTFASPYFETVYDGGGPARTGRVNVPPRCPPVPYAGNACPTCPGPAFSERITEVRSDASAREADGDHDGSGPAADRR